MVNMLDLDKLREIKKTRPELKVAAYIKSSPEGIALSDYCWTYEKALELLGESEDEVLFTPDIHLGQNLAYQLKRNIPFLGGYCPPHVKILAGNVRELTEAHPNAVVLAHPECRNEVVKLAHKVLSSEGMVRYVKASRKQEFIVASELDLVHRLARENPDKKIYPASTKAICHNMKLLDPGRIYWSLKDMIHRVRIAEDTSKKVRTVLEKTLK
jgi:quinolinate synthase